MTVMPRKIGFTVVSSSSHEDNCGANELMVHAPTVNGWRSGRFCSYPQHITLQLVERCRVRKLQLLAHQYLISSKVEFHIGDSLPENSPPGFPGQLRRLGYVSLSDNEKTGFKSRELKSVHVDAVGTYLRITFHGNHANRYNHYNQVALVAINVLGDTLDSGVYNTLPSREQLIEYYLNSSQQDAALDATLTGKCESISPLDDLAFDMYQDPEVAHIIRLLDQKKQDALRQGNNERSKNLKQAIADLQKVGERLARYDVEKQCAMDKGDFEEARKKKEQMEEYRKSVYQQLEVHNLLDMATIRGEFSPVQEPSSLRPSPGHRPVPAKHLVSSETSIKMKRNKIHRGQQPEAGAVSPKCSSQQDTRCTSASVPKIDVSVPYDEWPLPALQGQGRPAETPHSPAEQRSPHADCQWSPQSPELSGEPEPLTQKAQREAGFSIEVYGETLVAGAYSKSWSYREHAILDVCRKLSELPPTTPREEQRNMIRAAVSLLKKALLDKVASVFYASLKLLRLLLSQIIPSLGQSRPEVTHCLEQTWPNLLARTGESAGRIRAAATAFILEIAVLKDVRGLQVIPGELAKPFRSNFPSRLAHSRVQLVEKLLAEVGTENSGFTLDNVMTFCTAALEHSASGVREVAVRIILSMYQQHRAAVLGFLPPSDAAERKFFLYKTLFEGFAKMDGKLVETQTLKKGGSCSQDAQKEKEEIHSLQEQLAALKELTEKDDQGLMPKKEDPKVDEGSKKHGKAVPDVPTNEATNSSDLQESINYLDNLCIFCGKKDESFTEDGLDLHYWKHCPMLRRCDECRQVVEIASLTEHLLGECDSRSKFKQCQRCCEAVAADHLPRHVQSSACNPPTSSPRGSNHCPLCHSNFPPGEEAWKAHLMGREGCKQNARRATVSQRTQPAQGRVAAGAKLKQAWSAGARARPMGRGSRIPALARGHTRGKN